MVRTRDSQRSKVYAGEQTLPELCAVDLAVGAVQRAYLDAILTHPRVRARFGRRQVGLTWKKRGAQWSTAFCRSQRIALAPTHRSKLLLIHETAHILAPVNAVHHREWCEVYIFLVETMLGRDVASRLKAAFKAKGVKYSKKRTLTEAQRVALRERFLVNVRRGVAA